MDDTTRQRLERRLARLQRELGIEVSVEQQIDAALESVEVDDVDNRGRRKTATALQSDALRATSGGGPVGYWQVRGDA